jgi:hypothetical protein
MTNSEEGKKIIGVLRQLRTTINDYKQIPNYNKSILDQMVIVEVSLCADHDKLCCSKCHEYNDECTCP